MDKQIEGIDDPSSTGIDDWPAGITGGLAPWRLERVRQHVLADLSKKISVPQLAQACALSRSHFSRAFKRSTGMSPQDWIRHQRIAQAKRLITDSTLTLTQISAKCGFFDQAHFSHMFTRTEGTNPAIWRFQSLAVCPERTVSGHAET
ncbi:MAG TPA: AraC family transcriptional regulator [Pseudomonas sp.]|jgi:transcriptional regulator GlxA family with amidase domain